MYDSSEKWELNKREHRCIIVDVDGTLSDCTKRLEFNEKGKLNWKKFFAEIPNDPPHEWCARLVQIYHKIGFVIFIVTARPEEYRGETEAWMLKHGIPYDYLFTRRDGDNRADNIVKQEILDREFPDKSLIEFVVDDRQSVVDMWRQNGLTCLQCNSHQF